MNRSTIEPLQNLFTHAKKKWGARFDDEPDWRDHMLKEPDEHIRELRADEADAITLATRPYYDPFIAFARASGLRLRECLLTWLQVDWDESGKGKGGPRIPRPDHG